MIKHSVSFEGAVHELVVSGHPYTQTFSVGVMEPGEYNFGVATQEQEFHAVSGSLTINGKWFADGCIVIRQGDQITVKADSPTIFSRYFR